MTVLQGLVMAVAWPAAIIGALNGIENKWAIVVNRYTTCFHFVLT